MMRDTRDYPDTPSIMMSTEKPSSRGPCFRSKSGVTSSLASLPIPYERPAPDQAAAGLAMHGGFQLCEQP